jgi:hypothetical protein
MKSKTGITLFVKPLALLGALLIHVASMFCSVLGGYMEILGICLRYQVCDIQISDIQEPSWISCWAKY